MIIYEEDIIHMGDIERKNREARRTLSSKYRGMAIGCQIKNLRRRSFDIAQVEEDVEAAEIRKRKTHRGRLPRKLAKDMK